LTPDGLNPIAALKEAGILTVSKAMSTLHRFTDLVKFKELL
jgi:repressor of nif and glnA expression